MAPNQRVLIIGGSGRTGKLVVEEMLQRKHTVTALVRKPSAMQHEINAGLTAIPGTPLNKEDVHAAFTQSRPEVVIVTLSAPRASDSPFAALTSPPRLMADAVANIVAAMQEFRTPKIIIMQAFGVGKSWANMHWSLRLLMSKSNMIYQYDDHNLVAEETERSGVNYVFVRPVRLVEGEARPVKEFQDGKGVGVLASVSRGSVARFLVQAAERSDWDGSAPVIAS